MATASQELCDFFLDCESQINRILEEYSLDPEEAISRAERLLRYVILVEEEIPFQESETLCLCIMDMINSLQSVIDTSWVRRKGRPSIPISEEHLRSLLEYNYSIVDISKMMSVSLRIIQYGLEAQASYNPISESELDELTESFVKDNPDCGLKTYVYGFFTV